MKWYHYFCAFWAGMFLANFVPHFINGVSGNAFPTPFANPPGKGLSTPVINVLWAMFNLLVGYLLLRFSKTTSQNKLSILLLFIGIICMSVMLSLTFVDKMKM